MNLSAVRFFNTPNGKQVFSVRGETMLKNSQIRLYKYTENPVAMVYHTETINQRFSVYAYWVHAGIVRF